MSKATKTKNPCIICYKRVGQKKGVQCQGACKKWAHFSCLEFTEEKISRIKRGIEDVVCACPGCEPCRPINSNCLDSPAKTPAPCPNITKVPSPSTHSLCCPKCNCSKASKKKEKDSMQDSACSPCPTDTEVAPPCTKEPPVSLPPSSNKKSSGSIFTIFKKKTKPPKCEYGPEESPKEQRSPQDSCQTPTQNQCTYPTSQSANPQEVKRASKVHMSCQISPPVSNSSPGCSEDSENTSSASSPSFDRETRSNEVQCPSSSSETSTSPFYPKTKMYHKECPEMENYPQEPLKAQKSCQVTVSTPPVTKISKPSVCFRDSESSGNTSFSVSCPSVVADMCSDEAQCPSALSQRMKLYSVQPYGEQIRINKGSSCLGRTSSLGVLLSRHYIESTLERIADTLKQLTSQAMNLTCELKNMERQTILKKY